MKLRGYYSLVKVGIKESLYYSNRSFMMIISQVARLVMVFIVYKYAFNYTGSEINGVGFVETVWSIGMYFIILSPRIGHIFKDYSVDVRTGNVEMQLNKPYDYITKKIADYIGKGFLSFLIALFVIPLLLIIIAGVPQFEFTFLWLCVLILTTINSFVLAFLTYSIVGLTSFWLEDANPVFWIIDKLAMVFGGSYVPVSMFPFTLRLIAEYSPFGAMYLGTQVFNIAFIQNSPRFIITQLIWIAVAYALMQYMFHKVQYKLAVNGG